MEEVQRGEEQHRQEVQQPVGRTGPCREAGLVLRQELRQELRQGLRQELPQGVPQGLPQGLRQELRQGLRIRDTRVDRTSQQQTAHSNRHPQL